MKTSLVITTINKLNQNIRNFSKNCKSKKWDFIVIGDSKSPKNYNLDYGNFFNINNQKKLKFKFAKICPDNHYARKNIGYLIAIKDQNDIIIETDDDNYPYQDFFFDKKEFHQTRIIKNKNQWINIYDFFNKKKSICWPRGIPLDEIHNIKLKFGKKSVSSFLLQQGVCEGNPDVDAIFRLLNEKININFKKKLKINIKKSLVTLNSQNTIWFKKIFPLLYLPVTCTMRCTDIWRGLVAQKILNNDNKDILFFGTTMKQFRNDHSLMNDFEQEVPMYLLNKKINKILFNLKLPKGEMNYLNNLNTCYRELIKNNIISKNEIYFLNAWTNDYKKATK